MHSSSARLSRVVTRNAMSGAPSSEHAMPAVTVVASRSSSSWHAMRVELCELRWAVLTIICFLTFGASYIYDFPGAIGTGRGDTIESAFRQAGRPYTQSMNQLLYSVYSWPNTVLAMFGGLLIDKYLGLRRASLLFALLVCTGSVLFYTGMRSLHYPLLLTGRVVYGLGSESLGVSQSSYVARWFSGTRGMSFAFCITICFARVGSSFNFIVSPAMAKRHGVDQAVLLGVVACAVSLLACLVLIAVDAYAERVRYVAAVAGGPRRRGRRTRHRRRGGDAHDNHVDADADDYAAAADVVDVVDDDDDETTSRASVMHLSDVANMSTSFWLLCAICTLSYCALAPFFGMGRNFLEVKYGYSGHRASEYLSSYQLSSAALSPVIGLLVDAVGRNTWWLLLSNATFVVVFLLLLFTSTPALLLLMTLGCVVSFLSSSLWPAVPWVVQANMVGFSYGVMTAIQNIGLAIVPIAIGAILDHHTPSHNSNNNSSSSSGSHSCSSSDKSSSSSSSCYSHSSSSSADVLPSMRGYSIAVAMLTSIAFAALLMCVVLLVCDKRYARGVLSSSPRRRRQLLEEQVVLIDDATPEPHRSLLRTSVAPAAPSPPPSVPAAAAATPQAAGASTGNNNAADDGTHSRDASAHHSPYNR